MRRLFLAVVFLVAATIQLFSQSAITPEAGLEQRITNHVAILASDSLEGRESGTMGEYLARHYIAGQFKEIGLTPILFDNSYFQKFSYPDSPWYGKGNRLVLDGSKLKLYSDYYALNFSGCDSVEGETVFMGYGLSMPEEGIDDYAGKGDLTGKIFVIYTSLPEEFKKNAAVEALSGKMDKVNLAIKKGAKAVIFIRPEQETIEPNASLQDKEIVTTIPVVFLRNASLVSKSGASKVKLRVNIEREDQRSAYNVVGGIDNGAANWVVIGAHYDHLGWSMDDNGQPVVNNGADDNATGTAAVIELARFVKQSGCKKYNYVFCAFSGEEKGLIGSTYFTNSKTIEPEKINYMLDIDMIGRLDDKKELTIYGTGTSKEWKKVLGKVNPNGLKIKQVKSGFGGSDHMPFYFKQIPDLFLHTGLHPDYHTPADDANKINYQGMANIIVFAEELIKTLDGMDKLPFQKTTALQAVGAIMK